MKTPSCIRKSVYSALMFFGTLGILSAGYAGFVTLQSSDADSGKPLTSSMMQAVIGNLADLDSRVSSMSGAVTSLQGLWGTVTGGIGYSGGNVGIGTSSPLAKLDVSGGTYIRAFWPLVSDGLSVLSHGSTAYQWGVYMSNSSNFVLGAAETFGYKFSTAYTGNQTTSGLRIGVVSAANPNTYLTNDITLLNGNVGISNVNPGYRLDVAGTVNATAFRGDGSQLTNIWGGVPSGAVMAFYLASCPSGWRDANGSNSTPDLRWEFIRGMDASRTLGSVQLWSIESHNHIQAFHATYSGRWGQTTWLGSVYSDATNGMSGTSGAYTSSTGWTETRPRNVALLYCVKN